MRVEPESLALLFIGALSAGSCACGNTEPDTGPEERTTGAYVVTEATDPKWVGAEVELTDTSVAINYVRDGVTYQAVYEIGARIQ